MTNFWVGPFGMRVDLDVCEVPSIDVVNRVLREGGETEVGGGRKPALTRNEYLAAYAVKRPGDDNFWYNASPAEKGHPFTGEQVTAEDIRRFIAKQN
jgi:hypothetical protein